MNIFHATLGFVKERDCYMALLSQRVYQNNEHNVYVRV